MQVDIKGHKSWPLSANKPGGYYSITNFIDSMVKEYAFVIANEKTKVLNRVQEPESWQPPLHA